LYLQITERSKYLENNDPPNKVHQRGNFSSKEDLD